MKTLDLFQIFPDNRLHDLDCHILTQRDVYAFVHGAHTALSQQFNDAVLVF